MWTLETAAIDIRFYATHNQAVNHTWKARIRITVTIFL